MAQTKITQNETNIAVTTGTNSGASGGSTNYVNLGGVKYCCGITNSSTIVSAGDMSLAITFPISFTSAPAVTVTAQGTGSYANWVYGTTVSVTTSGFTGYLHNQGAGTTGSEYAHWIAIGV